MTLATPPHCPAPSLGRPAEEGGMEGGREGGRERERESYT